MSDIRTSANTTFRDYETAGVPASGAHEPIKSVVRDTFGVVEDRIDDVQAIADAAVAGIRWTPNIIRVRSTGNVVIASALENGDTLNGVVLATGDHVFLGSQTAPAENGLYTVPASGAAARATFADSAAELTRIGFVIQVGTVGAGERWMLPLAAADITVGTTALSFAPAGIEVDYATDIDARATALEVENTSLFADSFFALSRGQTSYTADGHEILSQDQNNRTWDANYAHAFGYGAFKVASGGAICGFRIWFDSPASVLAGVGTGDIITVGYLGAAAAATSMNVAARFFDAAGAWVGTQVGTASAVATGDLQLLQTSDLTVPSGAAGVEVWAYDGTPAGNIYIVDVMGAPGASLTLLARSRFALAPLAFPTNQLNLPTPFSPLMTPRVYGMVGYESRITAWGLISTAKPMAFDFSGGTGLGNHTALGWVWPTGLGITAAGDVLTCAVKDMDHLNTLASATTAVHVVAASAAAAGASTGLFLGDSTIEDGRATTQFLALATANANGVQPTLIGTVGTGANKFEGRGGWTVARYFDPGTTYYVANPFTRADGDKFNFAHYLTDYSLATPDWVLIHLGINDVFNLTTDAAVHAAMDTYLTQMDKIIGVTADAAVGSLKESNADIVTIIATPISPGNSQTGFGDDYAVAQNLWRYKRNIAIATYRIIEHYGASEAQNIFLLPWHTTVDPLVGFDEDSDPIHPNATGYAQMGNAAYYCVNVLAAAGEF